MEVTGKILAMVKKIRFADSQNKCEVVLSQTVANEEAQTDSTLRHPATAKQTMTYNIELDRSFYKIFFRLSSKTQKYRNIDDGLLVYRIDRYDALQQPNTSGPTPTCPTTKHQRRLAGPAVTTRHELANADRPNMGHGPAA
uniref:Uncharacterized protein n=1 Tax=Oryza brachyantha TaxID=4533 RepID=J3N824_ORYBR